MDRSARNVINHRILCIPPYVSTTWEGVSSIHTKGSDLIVTLFDGEMIRVPNLSQELINKVFAAHSAFIELEMKEDEEAQKGEMQEAKRHFIGQIPLGANSNMGIQAIDGASLLHHNPEQKNLPTLPYELLQKITSLTKMLLPEDQEEIPKPEPHCNCIHCQISRAMQHGTETSHEMLEEVSDDDLAFNQWQIEQSGENLYKVMNKLDADEQYNVFLGNPVGCTCGKNGCEHIIAVLKT